GHRGRHRRPQRDRDRDRARRALRPGPAPPAPRPRGRGRARGHCFLVVPDWTGEEAYQRLRMLERSTDGFRIAEADLALRGPGDFLGTRQAGLPPFRVANLVRDTALLRAARDEANAWLARDPDLSRPESAALRSLLQHRWRGRLELARVG